MVTVGVLDARLAAQLEANPVESSGLQVVCSDVDCETFATSVRNARPSVLVVNLENLGDEPARALDMLEAAAHPRLILTIYYFEKRELLRSLTGPTRRVLHGPITVAALRAQLTSLLVSDALASTRGSHE